jgi:hypothetical protein
MEINMVQFVALVGVAWLFVGGFVVVHSLQLGPVQSVLQRKR